MATKTLGTAGTTTLTAVQWNPGMSVSDLAAINALIKFQGTYASTTFRPTPVIEQGMIRHPTRGGSWRLVPGDWIGVDPVTGDFIFITAASAAGASWVHS